VLASGHVDGRAVGLDRVGVDHAGLLARADRRSCFPRRPVDLLQDGRVAGLKAAQDRVQLLDRARLDLRVGLVAAGERDQRDGGGGRPRPAAIVARAAPRTRAQAKTHDQREQSASHPAIMTATGPTRNWNRRQKK
jgi:hypothetical protein